MPSATDPLWQDSRGELIDRIHELEEHAAVLAAAQPIAGEVHTLEATVHPAASALDDAAIAIAARIVNGGDDLTPSDVSSLGYAAWCVAAAADNRQPLRAKSNPSDGS